MGMETSIYLLLEGRSTGVLWVRVLARRTHCQMLDSCQSLRVFIVKTLG